MKVGNSYEMEVKFFNKIRDADKYDFFDPRKFFFNRDVCLFPEKINNMYYALTRPAPQQFGKPEIWIAQSPDLLHWGNHKHLLSASKNLWDSNKLGGGGADT